MHVNRGVGAPPSSSASGTYPAVAFLFLLFLGCAAREILVPGPESEPMPLQRRHGVLITWTTREVPPAVPLKLSVSLGVNNGSRFCLKEQGSCCVLGVNQDTGR